MIVKQLLTRLALHLAVLTALLHSSAQAQTEPTCLAAPNPAATVDNDLFSDIKGSIEGLYSYRYQEHAFVTKQMEATGLKYYLTTIFNLGTLGGTNSSINIKVSPDGGKNWGQAGGPGSIPLGNSNGSSLSDAFLVGGNSLTIAHSFNREASTGVTAVHNLYFSNLNWLFTGTWAFTSGGTYTANTGTFTNTEYLAPQRPTIVKDKDSTVMLTGPITGRWWAAYTEDDVILGKDTSGKASPDDNHVMKVLYFVPGSNQWILIDPTFSPTDDITLSYFGTRNTSETKSARLVVLPDRVGLIYTDGACIPEPENPQDPQDRDFSCAPQYLKWSFHMNGDAPTIWSTQQILLDSDGINGDGMDANDDTSDNNIPADTGDPFGSHFTTVVDQVGNIHLVTRRGNRLVYLRYKADGMNSAWEPYRFLTSSTSQVGEYPQLTLQDPNIDAKVRVIYEQKVPHNVLCIQKSVENYGALPITGGTGFDLDGLSIDNNLLVAGTTQKRYPGNPRLEAPSYLDGFTLDGTTRILPFLRQYEYTVTGNTKNYSAVNYQFVISP